MAEGRQGVFPGWGPSLLLLVGVVALLRVVAFPDTQYHWYMWAAIFYCIGLPVAKLIDNVRSLTEKDDDKSG